MSKQVTDTGELWVEHQENGRVRLGFTVPFLHNHQAECWHIIPSSGKIEKGNVLLSLETNDGLIPVVSPVDGVIEMFEDKAINFPEKLTADTDIAQIRVEVIKPKSAKDYLKKTPVEKVAVRQTQRAQVARPLRAPGVNPNIAWGPPPPGINWLDEQNQRIMETQERRAARVQQEDLEF